MISTDVIKANYARQSDDWLLTLAQNEGETLTDEALGALQDEFRKRGLHSDVFINTLNKRKAIRSKVAEESAVRHYESVMESVWLYLIERKKNGVPDIVLWQELTSRGMPEEQATLLIWSLDRKIKEFIDKADTEMWTGIGLLVLGLLLFLASQQSQNGFVYIPIGLVVGGVIRFFTGQSSKEKLTVTLKAIEAKKDLQER